MIYLIKIAIQRMAIVILMLSLLSVSSLQGQEQKKDDKKKLYSSVMFGLGGKQENISFLSPLYYQKTSFSFNYLSMKQRKNRMISSNYIFTNTMATEYDEEETTKTLNATYDLTYQNVWAYHLNGITSPESKLKIAIGPAYMLDAKLDLKTDNENNPFNFGFNNMACLGVHLNYHIKGLYFFNETLLPVLGLYTGSDYGYVMPSEWTSEDGNVFKGFNIGSFNINKQIVNRLNCDVKLNLWRSVRTLRLQYEIGAQKLNLNNNTRHYVSHMVRVGFLINKTTTQYIHE